MIKAETLEEILYAGKSYLDDWFFILCLGYLVQGHMAERLIQKFGFLFYRLNQKSPHSVP